MGAPVTDTIWAGTRAVVATSSGNVKVYENGSDTFDFGGHAGEITALAVHPSGDILASVGLDKSYIFYDLTSHKQVLRVITDSCKLSRPAEVSFMGYS